jgi:serine/threonine protein phosphatase 1
MLAELEATSVPTWRPPRVTGADAAALTFVLAPGRLPRGRRIYAIGDIHGCLEALQRLHATIADDMRRHPTAAATLIHLGDYIDGGPHSAGVVALLAAGPPVVGLRTINLMGDHERTALDALAGDGAAATDWLHTGGDTALASWGISSDVPRSEWTRLIPEAHVAFMRGLALEHREGDYLFVHAGIRPGVRLDQQTEEDMLGIRQSFLASESEFGAIIVHGHTASPTQVIKPNRIGLDTGAGFGGKLTAAVFEDDGVAFMSA